MANVTEQIAEIRESLNYVVARVETLETRYKDMEAKLTDVQNVAHEIKEYLTHFKGFAGFFKKHGGKIAAFAVGYAVSRGYVDAEIAEFLRTFI